MNIATFLNKLQARLNEHKEAMGITYFDHYEIIVTEGKRFFKVIRKEANKYGVKSYERQIIIAFVDKNTGEIFKPATWSAPAKHVRGNVNSSQNGMEAINSQGFVRYLK
jgi:hypothetical protein